MGLLSGFLDVYQPDARRITHIVVAYRTQAMRSERANKHRTRAIQ